MEKLLEQIREELKNNSDEKTLASSQRFFKETIKSYGVKVPVVNKISKEFYKLIDPRTKTKIFELCECLWQSGYWEESIIACNWSYTVHKEYKPEDFQLFERWINQYVDNWASCDTLCNHTVGEFIEMYPGYIERLKDFARSNNRWIRRAAAVSLIVPAR
ncbi:MAG: DNA alkylation repair protein, partial [Bacteroidota bacterium]|nr:DNA alkylation repair protein [Bacteroidota bacterium]